MASECFSVVAEGEGVGSRLGRSIAERSGQETAEKFPRDRPGVRKLSSNSLSPLRLSSNLRDRGFRELPSFFLPAVPLFQGFRVARFRRLSGAFRGKSLENQPQPLERAATNSCGRLGFSPSYALLSLTLLSVLRVPGCFPLAVGSAD